eukprot:GHVT01007983.1.p1 GENE.GHVT01007983.1~~GHVT01007983.1.p1  ORF type:complete len:270 (+),score=10.49 GHVT01007983.1:1412-2221(+)
MAAVRHSLSDEVEDSIVAEEVVQHTGTRVGRSGENDNTPESSGTDKDSNVARLKVYIDLSVANNVKLLSDLAPRLRRFGSYLRTTIRYHTFSMESEYHSSYCLLPDQGKFCSFVPDDAAHPIQGNEVVQENLLQLCLFDISGDGKAPSGGNLEGSGWKYLEMFEQECKLGPEAQHDDFRRFMPECSRKLLKTIGIEPDLLQTHCSNDNRWAALLEEQVQDATSVMPTIHINGQLYERDVAGEAIVAGICRVLSNPPDFCIEAMENAIKW